MQTFKLMGHPGRTAGLSGDNPARRVISLFRRLFLLSALVLLGACSSSHPLNSPEPQIKQLGGEPFIDFPGHETATLVGPEESLSGLALMELIVPPHSVGAPPHMHELEDEVFLVLSGELAFLQGEDNIVAAPAGTMAVLTRGHLHAFWNPGEAPAQVLLAISPGDFEGFFDEVVMRLRESGASDPETVGAIVAELAAARGVTLFPEKLPPEAAALMGR